MTSLCTNPDRQEREEMSQAIDYSPKCPAGRAAYWDYPIGKGKQMQAPYHRDDRTLCACSKGDAATQAVLRMAWLEQHWPWIRFEPEVKINYRASTLGAAIDEVKK